MMEILYLTHLLILATTAHAVMQSDLKLSYIMIEVEDYADTITAERVKRVIDGYGEGKNAVDGTGGNFSYYELEVHCFCRMELSTMI